MQAGRLPNPHFYMLWASQSENGVREYKIEQALTFNLFALITLPLAVEVEKRNFEQTQRELVIEIARLASQTRQAYFTAVAAAETPGMDVKRVAPWDRRGIMKVRNLARQSCRSAACV